MKFKMNPSKVLYVRYVASEATRDNLLDLVAPFGVAQKFVIMEKNRALIQMGDVKAATAVIQHYSESPAKIKGGDVHLQFSLHQELRRQSRKENDPDRRSLPSRVLWTTIHKPLHPNPLSIRMFHDIFSPFGFVEKIIMFESVTGPQSLLQFAAEESAVQARNSLHGRDIYDGCCTLDIKYSDFQELHVGVNSNRMWDFTVQFVHPNNRLFMEQRAAIQMYGSMPINHIMPSTFLGDDGAESSGSQDVQSVLEPHGRSTLLVSKLNPDKMDADKLFNLFSNYGHVVRIKILDTKPDQALVQMEDGSQAQMALEYLHGVMLFGRCIQILYSKHDYITPSQGSREFSNSSNPNGVHRFVSPQFNYRHCCAPTSMLHVARIASDVDMGDISSHLADHGTIIKSRLFEFNGRRQALVLFKSVQECTEALVCKHASMLKGKAICLSFSKQAYL
ncbi:hypothetical protein Mapa_014158 [Marchantia paleacea]|nr:hypothetical protein Mapa_014158 [Marchantia paleacea]